MNALEKWCKLYCGYIEKTGFKVSYEPGYQSGYGSVNIDNLNVVGTITFWPEDQYEFYFINCNSGETIIMETVQINGEENLSIYFKNNVWNKISLQSDR